MPPKYFAFGNVTTSSTTDYTTIGKKVFAALWENGIKGVCIVRNNILICFQSNNHNIETKHMVEVFSNVGCVVYSTDTQCRLASDFKCGDFNRDRSTIYCGDLQTDEFCNVYYDGEVVCQ